MIYAKKLYKILVKTICSDAKSEVIMQLNVAEMMATFHRSVSKAQVSVVVHSGAVLLFGHRAAFDAVSHTDSWSQLSASDE